MSARPDREEPHLGRYGIAMAFTAGQRGVTESS